MEDNLAGRMNKTDYVDLDEKYTGSHHIMENQEVITYKQLSTV